MDIDQNRDLCLPKAEFAFNNMKNWSTSKTPFEVVYTHPPRLTLDLISLPSATDLSSEAEIMVYQVQSIHKEVIDHLQEGHAKYAQFANTKKRHKEFAEGDLVLVHLKKERFPKGLSTS